MHAKQECVDSLKYFNDTVFLTPDCVFAFFATKQIVLLIEAAPASTPYCLSSLLATVNQIRRLGEAPHGSRVCEQYTRQDHSMENSVKIVQYYKVYSINGSSTDTHHGEHQKRYHQHGLLHRYDR